MRTITRSELAYLNQQELDGLLALVLRNIHYAREGSPEWLCGLASLDNIRQEQAARNATPQPRSPRGPGF
ncbi:MAG: hypothetical protein AAB403_23145 [Planctomycetota bacterium]